MINMNKKILIEKENEKRYISFDLDWMDISHTALAALV